MTDDDDRRRHILSRLIAGFDTVCHSLCAEYGHGPDLHQPLSRCDVVWCLGEDPDDLDVYIEARAAADLPPLIDTDGQWYA